MARKRDHERNTSGLTAHAQRRSDEARRRVMEAIDRLVEAHSPITFKGVAEAAGVSTPYLYGQPDLRERIDFLRDRNSLTKLRASMPDRVRTDKSKDVLLAAKDKRIWELEEENKRLKKELQAALGRIYEEI